MRGKEDGKGYLSIVVIELAKQKPAGKMKEKFHFHPRSFSFKRLGFDIVNTASQSKLIIRGRSTASSAEAPWELPTLTTALRNKMPYLSSLTIFPFWPVLGRNRNDNAELSNFSFPCWGGFHLWQSAIWVRGSEKPRYTQSIYNYTHCNPRVF